MPLILRVLWSILLFGLTIWVLIALSSSSHLGILGVVFFSIMPGYSALSNLSERLAASDRLLVSVLISLSMLVGLSSLPGGFSLSHTDVQITVAVTTFTFLTLGSRQIIGQLAEALAK